MVMLDLLTISIALSFLTAQLHVQRHRYRVGVSTAVFGVLIPAEVEDDAHERLKKQGQPSG